MRKILVIRSDRIGDVVLTLPMAEVLKSTFPEARIFFLVKEYTAPIAMACPYVDGVLTVDRNGNSKSVFELGREIKKARFNVVISAFPRFGTAFASSLAGIPLRIGTAHRWYSLFFNDRVDIHRRDSVVHEARHNISLLRGLDITSSAVPYPVLSAERVDPTVREKVEKQFGIDNSTRLAVVHPGSGGSAREWSPERFAECARLFVRNSFRVIITGSQNERNLAENIRTRCGVSVANAAGELDLNELIALLSRASALVANSTGPLHVAAALGVSVAGIYPPLRNCTPDRWGPIGKRAFTFVPDPSACTLCKGRACRSNVCMDQIEPAEVVGRLIRSVNERTE